MEQTLIHDYILGQLISQPENFFGRALSRPMNSGSCGIELGLDARSLQIFRNLFQYDGAAMPARPAQAPTGLTKNAKATSP